MRYCRSCKFNIENDLKKCPLCGTHTEEKDKNYNNDYPKVENRYITDLINQAMLFIAIAISIVSLFVNRYLARSVPWSFIAIIGVFYLLLSSKFILNKGKNYGFFVLTQVVLISIVIFLIDHLIGYNGWSVDYVIPFVIISGSLAISTISIISPFKYKEYIVYLLIIALLGLIPLVLILCGVAKVYWTSAVCVIYSVLTVLAMIIFSRRKLNTELKKRLHF